VLARAKSTGQSRLNVHLLEQAILATGLRSLTEQTHHTAYSFAHAGLEKDHHLSCPIMGIATLLSCGIYHFKAMPHGRPLSGGCFSKLAASSVIHWFHLPACFISYTLLS